MNETPVVLGFQRSSAKYSKNKSFQFCTDSIRGEKKGNSPIHLMRPLQYKFKSKYEKDMTKKKKKGNNSDMHRLNGQINWSNNVMDYFTTVAMNFRDMHQHSFN